jgi:hypothetical protein
MIEYLLLVLTGTGIIASIVYYATIIQNANKARQRELLFQRITLNNYEFYYNWLSLRRGFRNITNYKEWMEYITENPEHYARFASMTWTFHNIGLLLRNNMIDIETVFGAYSPYFVIWLWELGEPLIKVWRESINFPSQYEGFEYLYNEARRKYPQINGIEEFDRAIQQMTGYYTRP